MFVLVLITKIIHRSKKILFTSIDLIALLGTQYIVFFVKNQAKNALHTTRISSLNTYLSSFSKKTYAKIYLKLGTHVSKTVLLKKEHFLRKSFNLTDPNPKINKYLHVNSFSFPGRVGIEVETEPYQLNIDKDG